MKLHWVASGLLSVDGQFRKVKGCPEIPQLIAALNAAAPGGRLPAEWQRREANVAEGLRLAYL